MSTRRGLGKGLGALIPSATGKPAAPEAPEADEAPDATSSPTDQDAAAAPAPASGGTAASAVPTDTARPTVSLHDERDQPHRDGQRHHVEPSSESPRSPHGSPREPQPAPESQTTRESAVSRAAEPAQPAQPALPAQGDPATVQGASLAEVPVEEIRTNPRQPRQAFDEDALAELTHSIKEVGLLQPVVVRRQPDEDGYLLIMGERRLRAAKDAGLETLPAIVRETTDDDLLRDALLENLHRVQLNPLEEAAAYGQLLEDFGCTHEELADRIGRSRPQITNTIRLLKLPPSIQRRVAAGVLSAGHARALLMVSDEARQEHLAHRVVAEGLSVRALEELVALDDQPEKKQQKKSAAPKPVAPKVVELQDRLSDRFETRVKVDLGRSKGKITVEFASVDDLERIVALMDPETE